ncbi:hypothetical protein ZIOFF_035102 [Zingiber officinale]|uniref:Uncharacterized protein n=1 Tax=Zingiber officinale TaxID=94328 RepID=A0A8J5GE89_ZINOF|nr:hypothetical protein ZIOFF_035102 [Zingiber officinale]
MSKVWEFKNGVMRKVENPGSSRPRKVLVYLPAVELVLSSSSGVMSEVWEFKNGMMRKVENPGGCRPRKLLVYLPAVEVITSHQMLENRLRDEGWVHYLEMPLELIQPPNTTSLCSSTSASPSYK